MSFLIIKNLPINTFSHMRRNSSIDNFWMLVAHGDLPCPDEGVLSETLWSLPKGQAPPQLPNRQQPALVPKVKNNVNNINGIKRTVAEDTFPLKAKKTKSG